MSAPEAAGRPSARLSLARHLEYLREIGLTGLRLGPAAPPGAGNAVHPPAGEARRDVASGRPAIEGLFGGGESGAHHATAGGVSGPGAALEIDRTSTPEAAAASLEALRSEEIGDCRRCALCEGRNTIVFGSGNPRARLMFVGEGPGRDEDAQGLPFVGRAGQLLTDIIAAMKLTRGQVYIANVVKCRPPENRTPLPEEVEACVGFLRRQISIVAPDVIVCLGAVAVQALLGTTTGITKLRGQFREYSGIPVMATYHPAYLLRNPAKKREVWEDMKMVMARLAS